MFELFPRQEKSYQQPPAFLIIFRQFSWPPEYFVINIWTCNISK